MKNLEMFFNSKKGKVVAWLIVLLVFLLATFAIWFFKTNMHDSKQFEDNQIEVIKQDEDILLSSGDLVSSGELDSENISILSEEEYYIDTSSNTISFDNVEYINSFVLSDDPDGPTKDDIWHDTNGEKEIKLENSEVIKKYVYYKGGDYVPGDGDNVTIDTSYTKLSELTINGKKIKTSSSPYSQPAGYQINLDNSMLEENGVEWSFGNSKFVESGDYFYYKLPIDADDDIVENIEETPASGKKSLVTIRFCGGATDKEGNEYDVKIRLKKLTIPKYIKNDNFPYLRLFKIEGRKSRLINNVANSDYKSPSNGDSIEAAVASVIPQGYSMEVEVLIVDYNDNKLAPKSFVLFALSDIDRRQYTRYIWI